MTRKKYGDFNNQMNKYVKLIPYLESFLNNYSESSKSRIYLELVSFALYCKDNFNKGVLEIQGTEVLSYLKNIIDEKEVMKATKQRIRIFISAYYNYVKEFKKQIENNDFESPVPSSKIFSFSGKSNPLEQINFEKTTMTIQDIKNIFAHLYYIKSYKLYIVIALIVFSGARISEVLNIKLKNISLKERWFITPVKSHKNNKRDGIYFFPSFFVSSMKRYIKLLKLEHENWSDSNFFLFPSRNNKPLTPRPIQKCMSDTKEELRIKSSINPHAFRDFINTKRFEIGCNKTLRKFLINQKVKDVNPANYLKKYKNRIELRNVYDKYNPFTKSILPEPKLI